MIRLKELRLNKNCSQSEVAEYLGITQQAYANYEREARQADYDTLHKLSLFFNSSIDYILGHNTSEQISQREALLLLGFRKLNSQGQDYILDTIDMALTKFQKEDMFIKEANYTIAAYGADETEGTQPPIPEQTT